MSSVVGQSVRKQVYDLTLADLEAARVWEFALGEEGEEDQDEATVRPHAYEGVLDSSDGMFIVGAQFALADGTRMRGYLTPPIQGQSDLGTHQPVIVVADGQVLFWCGMISPSAEDISKSYARLGKASPESVFPIRFESCVPLKGGGVLGEIPGFVVLEDFVRMKTRLLR